MNYCTFFAFASAIVTGCGSDKKDTTSVKLNNSPFSDEHSDKHLNEKSRETTDFNNLDTVLIAVNTTLADEAGFKDLNSKQLNTTNNGTTTTSAYVIIPVDDLFDNTNANYDGSFAKGVREYLFDSIPKLSASKNISAKIFIQIVKDNGSKQITVFAADSKPSSQITNASVSAVTECDTLEYSDGTKKHFWVGYLKASEEQLYSN